MNLGTSYYHLKKFDQAVEEYRTALGIDPKVAIQQSPWEQRSTPAGQIWNSTFYMAKAYRLHRERGGCRALPAARPRGWFRRSEAD